MHSKLNSIDLSKQKQIYLISEYFLIIYRELIE